MHVHVTHLVLSETVCRELRLLPTCFLCPILQRSLGTGGGGEAHNKPKKDPNRSSLEWACCGAQAPLAWTVLQNTIMIPTCSKRPLDRELPISRRTYTQDEPHCESLKPLPVDTLPKLTWNLKRSPLKRTVVYE